MEQQELQVLKGPQESSTQTKSISQESFLRILEKAQFHENNSVYIWITITIVVFFLNFLRVESYSSIILTGNPFLRVSLSVILKSHDIPPT